MTDFNPRDRHCERGAAQLRKSEHRRMGALARGAARETAARENGRMNASSNPMGAGALRTTGLPHPVDARVPDRSPFDSGAHRSVPFVRAVQHRLRHPGGQSALRRNPRHRRTGTNAGRPAGRIRSLGRRRRIACSCDFNPRSGGRQRQSPVRGAARIVLRPRRRNREWRAGRLRAAKRHRGHDRHECVDLRRSVRRLRGHSENDNRPCWLQSPAETFGASGTPCTLPSRSCSSWHSS